MCQLVEDYANQRAAERVAEYAAAVQAAKDEAREANLEAQAAKHEAQAAKREAMEARQMEREAFARRLLSTGTFEQDTIAALTGLSPERVGELQAN